MKLITRDTDYALRAVSYIVKNKKRVVTAAEMVGELKIPRPFLRKILQVLSKKGIISSSKGRGGGFILALKPEKIYLLDIVRVFQGPLKLNECTLNKKKCPLVRSCALSRRIGRIEDHVIGELKSVTVAALLR